MQLIEEEKCTESHCTWMYRVLHHLIYAKCNLNGGRERTAYILLTSLRLRECLTLNFVALHSFTLTRNEEEEKKSKWPVEFRLSESLDPNPLCPNFTSACINLGCVTCERKVE